ncbi:MAG: T9SS type A sorting domain-containing protein [Bacteroidales bacterium]|nr:T9SS type A sorting domain-containing protein [Bacteroidales bacterium]
MNYKSIITLIIVMLCCGIAKAQDPTPILVHAEKNLAFTYIEEKYYDGTDLASGRENLFIIKNAKSVVNDGDEVYVETVLRYMIEDYDTGEWSFVTEPGSGYSIFGFNTLAGKDKDKYELAEEDKKMLVCDAYASIKMIPLTITPPTGKYTYGESEIGKDIKATVEPEQPGFFEYLVYKTSSYVKIAVGAMLGVGENLLQIWYRIEDNAHYKADQKETTITVEAKTIDYEGELIIKSKPKDGTSDFLPVQIEKIPELKGVLKGDDVQLAIDFANTKYPKADPGEYEVKVNFKLTGEDAGNYILSKSQETVTVKIEKEPIKTVELEGDFLIYPRYFDNTTNIYEGEVVVPTIKNKTEGDDVKIAVDYTQTVFPEATIGEHIVKIIYTLDGKDAYKYTLAKTFQHEKGEIKAFELKVNQTPDSKGVYQLEYTQSEIGFDLRISNMSNENETAKYFVNGEDITGKMLTAGAYTIKAVMYQYDLQVAEAEWKVNVKKLKLKITDPQVQHTKVYDGTKSVELIGKQCEITNSLESDNITIASQTQEYDTPEIGSGKKITVSFTLSGDITDKYIAPDNVVYTDGVISPGKIDVSDIKLIKADYCQGEEAKIILTISDGVPQTAFITFDDAAKQNGFTDLEINDLTIESENEKSFTLTIPETASGGSYNGEITLTDPLGTVSQKYSFSITVNYPNSFIVPKFNDVVLVNNYTEQFTEYQWYKNGEKIDGATLQFYCDPNGINGIYSVEVTSTQGAKTKICGAELTAQEQAVTKSLAKKIEVYPNPATSSQPINIKLVNLSENDIENANMVIINSIGNKVMQLKNLSEEFDISLPKGSYTITIIFNQQKISTKVIVNN